MSEPDKAEVRAHRARRHPRVPRRRLRAAAAAEPGARARDDELARLRGRARRVRADDARGDGARRHATRARSRSAPTPKRAPTFPVVVIGCGQSGLLAGIRLQEAGIPFTIIEKNPDVGGTWFENSYPGCRVDVGNHFYCYSFEPSDQWTEYFAQQPEIQSYFADVMHRHGIDRHIRWKTEVVSATWRDDTRHLGRGRAARPTGASETITARAVISAVGQLNRPNLPDIPGVDDVRGRVVPLRALGPLGRLPGQARRGRSAPARAASRSCPTIARRRRRADGVPAHRAVDVPEPELPREGRARRAVGAAPPPVLRPLVSLLVVLAGLRRRARRGARRSRSGRIRTARGQRDERHHPRDLHRVDRRAGRRRSRAARQGHPRLPRHRQAHAAGQRQLAARAQARQRRARARGNRPHRRARSW